VLMQQISLLAPSLPVDALASAVARLEALAMDASQRSMPMQAALMGSQPLVPVSLSMAGVEASSPSGDAVSLAGSLDFGADDDADDGADADDAEDPAAYLDASGYQPNPDYGGGGLDMDALPSQYADVLRSRKVVSWASQGARLRPGNGAHQNDSGLQAAKSAPSHCVECGGKGMSPQPWSPLAPCKVASPPCLLARGASARPPLLRPLYGSRWLPSDPRSGVLAAPLELRLPAANT